MDCHYIIVLALTIASIILPIIHGLESDNIIGGRHAKKGQFKYQVGIYHDTLSFCGGALIRPRLVLTAGHCTIDEYGDFYSNQLRVVAGIVQLNDASSDRIEIGVKKIYLPKEYREQIFWQDDIAVLKLIDMIDFTKHPNIEAVQLPTNHLTWAGQSGVIAGFGWNWIAMVENPDTGEPEEMGFNLDNTMSYLQVDIMKNMKCRFLYKTYDNVNRKQLCGKPRKFLHYSQQTPCNGDSGSPLVVGNTVVGLLSAGSTYCDEHEKPSIFTRVSEYMPFIKSVMANENQKNMKIYKIPKEMRYYPMGRY